MTTGELIKQARQNSKMTQKELAEKVGVSYQMIQAWENNRRNPKTETLKKIAVALNVQWFELYSDDPHEQSRGIIYDISITEFPLTHLIFLVSIQNDPSCICCH